MDELPCKSQLCPKWYWLYFVLAAFDLLTISLSLYLNHRLMTIYKESVRVNQAWAERLNRYSDIAYLAGAVDAPGNNVFDSQAVQQEYQRLQASVIIFNQSYREARDELDELEPSVAASLRKELTRVWNDMETMRAEAEALFQFLRNNQWDKAGERMAAMDRKYAEVNAGFSELNQRAREIQKAHFATQKAAAASLARYETAIALGIAVMVLGVTLYGHKLATTMMAAETELKSLNETLEQNVAVRTAQAERLVKKLRVLTSELQLTEERERRRLAADLHDDLGQKLALARIKFATLDHPGNPAAQANETLREIKQLVDASEKQVRSLTFQLSPPILDQLGLVPAVQWLADEMLKNYQLDVSIDGDLDPIRLEDQIRFALFRSVRELLINIAKHAATDRARIRFFWLPHAVRLEVKDEGQGFDPSQAEMQSEHRGYGLFSIRERIENLGGQFHVESAPGAGTRVTLEIPLS
jgi:signal transduction histidine kinase